MNRKARIEELAWEYVKVIAARRALGDGQAKYHSQRPKVEAYRLLMEEGLTPRAAVAEFKRLCNAAPIRTLSCGCCTNGCCCWMHSDAPNGRPQTVCDYHKDPAHPHPRETSPLDG